MTRRLAAAAALIVVAAVGTGCSGGGSAPAVQGVRVVATTTVFADFVRSVGGKRVSVQSLVPKGGDVHTFDPRPSDIARVADAQLIVANGLGLDDWLTGLALDAGTKARVLRLADGVASERYIVEDGIANPHLWLDPGIARRYAGVIASALGEVDPAHVEEFRENLDALNVKLGELETWGKGIVGALPADHRKLISFHDALPYLARAYGLQIAGVIVNSPGQDPSASDIVALVDAIRAQNVHVVVSEVQFSDKLARTVAEETGATIVSDIYDDSLGDPPVDSYDGLVRHDLERLVAALEGGGR